MDMAPQNISFPKVFVVTHRNRVKSTINKIAGEMVEATEFGND